MKVYVLSPNIIEGPYTGSNHWPENGDLKLVHCAERNVQQGCYNNYTDDGPSSHAICSCRNGPSPGPSCFVKQSPVFIPWARVQKLGAMATRPQVPNHFHRFNTFDTINRIIINIKRMINRCFVLLCYVFTGMGLCLSTHTMNAFEK